MEKIRLVGLLKRPFLSVERIRKASSKNVELKLVGQIMNHETLDL